MFNFGKDKKDDEETAEQRMAKNIANLSNQIGALQQQLVDRNKQVDELNKQLGATKAGHQDAATAQESLRRAQQQAKDSQDQMHILQRQVEELRQQATSSSAAATSSAAPSAGAGSVETPGTSGATGGGVSGVRSGAGVLGAGADMQPVPASPAATQPAMGVLAVGNSAYVQRAGGKNLRRRSAPSLESHVIDGLEPGTHMTLLAGPTQAAGHAWWHIRTDDGREGWVAGEELVTQPD